MGTESSMHTIPLWYVAEDVEPEEARDRMAAKKRQPEGASWARAADEEALTFWRDSKIVMKQP